MKGKIKLAVANFASNVKTLKESRLGAKLHFLYAKNKIAKKYSNRFRIFLICVALIIFSFFALEYYFKNFVLNLPLIKKNTHYFIRKELNRAVDFGVLDFSLISGVKIEDILISGREDFSDKEILLKAEKVNIEFHSLFSGKPYIKRVVIDNAVLDINLEATTRDENYFTLLENYIRRIDSPEIQIRHLIVKIRNGDLAYLDNDIPVDLELAKKKDIVTIKFKENKVNLFTSERISGTGVIENDRVDLQANINGANIASIQGILKEFYFIKEPSGLASGNINWAVSRDKIEISGNIYADKIKASSSIIDYKMNLINFTHRFQFNSTGIKSQREKKTAKENNYTGEFESNRIKFIIKNQNNRNISYSISSHDLSALLGSKTGKADDEESKMEMNLVMTDKDSDWIHFEGGLFVKNFYYVSDELVLMIDGLNLSINQSGNIVSDIKGKLYNQDFITKIAGKITVNRGKKNNGEYFYPIKSDFKVNGKLVKLILADVQPLINLYSEKIKNSIAERERKLLPEKYFFYQPLYKLFLQNLNVQFDLELNSLVNNYVDQGVWKISGINHNDDLKVKITGNNALGQDNLIILNSSYGILKPTIFLSASLNLPWQGETISWCGGKMTSGLVDIKYQYSSYGNNFMELANTRSEKLKAVYRKNKIKDSYLPENYFTTISFDQDSYAGKGNRRSFVIEGNGLKLNGYGEFDRNNYDYYLFGTLNGTSVNYKIEDNGRKCQVK